MASHYVNSYVKGGYVELEVLRKWAEEFCNLHGYVQGVFRVEGVVTKRNVFINNPTLRMD